VSILHAYARPWAVFDVKKAEHRLLYARFLKTRSWKNCPVQFVLDPDYSDITSMIENKLSAYYLAKETGLKIKEKPYQVVREKSTENTEEISWAQLNPTGKISAKVCDGEMQFDPNPTQVSAR